MSTTTKRSPGRPKKTQETQASTPQKKQSKPRIRRVESTPTIKQYKAIRSGAVMMLMQSGITVYDEESGRVREIRYCENEHSIFKDEQNEKSEKTPIIFRMGNLVVRGDQPNLQAYLDVHPQNRANGGGMFYLVDKTKNVENEIDKEFLVNDAINMLRNKDLDEILAVALAYGMDVNRPTSEIKHDLLQKAKKSPQTFMESFDNPIVAMKSKIRQAVSYNLIKASQEAVKWFDTNKIIVSVPAGQDPVDVFVRYCMTEAAAPVVAEIERQLG